MNRAISISIKEKKEVIWYSVKWRKDQELQSCESSEYPRPELERTLQAFDQFVPIITMIPTENIKHITVAGATFATNQKTGFTTLTLGVVIYLTNNYALEMRLPEKRVVFDDDEVKKSTMWEDRFSVLAQRLNDEILQYAYGNRAQQHLFETDDTEGEIDG